MHVLPWQPPYISRIHLTLPHLYLRAVMSQPKLRADRSDLYPLSVSPLSSSPPLSVCPTVNLPCGTALSWCGLSRCYPGVLWRSVKCLQLAVTKTNQLRPHHVDCRCKKPPLLPHHLDCSHCHLLQWLHQVDFHHSYRPLPSAAVSLADF